MNVFEFLMYLIAAICFFVEAFVRPGPSADGRFGFGPVNLLALGLLLVDLVWLVHSAQALR